jgi:phosphopantothenoylcysteine synthetase/decarboxylase
LILTEDKRKTEEKNKDLLEKWNSSRQQLEFFRKDNSTSQMMDNLEKVRAEKEAKDKECLEQLR